MRPCVRVWHEMKFVYWNVRPRKKPCFALPTSNAGLPKDRKSSKVKIVMNCKTLHYAIVTKLYEAGTLLLQEGVERCAQEVLLSRVYSLYLVDQHYWLDKMQNGLATFGRVH